MKLMLCREDYDASLRLRRLAAVALLALGLVGLACYFLLAYGGASGAYYYTVSNLLSVTLFFIGTAAAYRFVGKTTNG